MDEFRDLAGNRLDGDWDDSAGGNWMARLGESPTFLSSMSSCRSSSGWFNTLLGPVWEDTSEAGGIEVSGTVSIAADWWRLDVSDSGGELVYRKEFARAGLPFGSVYWDGRNGGGEAVPNAVYTATLIPLNANRDRGQGCHVSFAIDNPLEP